MRLHDMSSHEALMRVYTSSTRPDSRSSFSQMDLDVIRTHHQFLRDDDADAERGATDWQVRMSVRYYRRLFREYALADLSQYRDGRVGLRWRTEREVVTGKGQFVCGNKRCDARVGLRSYELLFAYREQRETKRCLVKVRACEACAGKLFYRKLRDARRQREKEKEAAAPRAVASSPKDTRSSQKTSDKRAQRATGDRATRESERDSGQRSKRQRRTRSSQDDSDARSRDSEHDADERQSSVHGLCAAINARERRAMRTSSSSGSGDGDPSQQRLGFFEDRAGSDHEQTEDDDALFRDLLV